MKHLIYKRVVQRDDSPEEKVIEVKEDKQVNLQDEYVKNIRFGVSSIDTNLELKKFITRHNDKKQVFKDQT